MYDTESNPTVTSDNSILYQAIKDNKLEDIKQILNDGKINVNDPIITSGPYAGFTALHVACMEKNYDVATLLVNNYKADVNAVAKDGTQPIHLECLYEGKVIDKKPTEIFTFRSDNLYPIVNVNAELEREIFSKHVKGKEWCPDFGDKMSILTYAIIYDKPDIAWDLISFNANVNIKSLTNKTLLMYAIEKNVYDVAEKIVLKMDVEFITARDDSDGRLAIHYLFHPDKYGDFRYDAYQLFKKDVSDEKGEIIRIFYAKIARASALINDDPVFILPNLATYRSCPHSLKNSLSNCTSIAHSKALYIATLPVDENSDKYLRIPERFNLDINPMEQLSELRRECTGLILQDLAIRPMFGLPVPQEEKQLMDQLIATDTDVKNFVQNCKTSIEEAFNKREIIKYDDKSITLYDFCRKALNDKQLKLLVKDESLMNAWKMNKFRGLMMMGLCGTYFGPLVTLRVEAARKRFELLEKLKNISQLKEAIPLPYELVLDIIEYLNNTDFEIFINAFISP